MNASACDVDLELPPHASSVTEARHAVSELARAAGAPEDDVALAVSEAVGNAVVHAFRFGRVGTIRVSAHRTRATFVVTVTDDGVGMVPDLNRPGLGLGTSLISRLAKDVTFEATEGGTTVTMRFELKRRRA